MTPNWLVGKGVGTGKIVEDPQCYKKWVHAASRPCCLAYLKKRDFQLGINQEDRLLIFKLFQVLPNNSFGVVWKWLSDGRLKVLLQDKDGILSSLFLRLAWWFSCIPPEAR